ncbi:MAG: hypothetical protein ABTD50_14720 [Polyangiaceae bacterium]
MSVTSTTTPGAAMPTDSSPRLPRPAPATLVHMTVGLQVVSVMILGRFGLNFGTYTLNAALIALYVSVGAAALCGYLALSVRRLCLYCACVGLAIASYWVNERFAHVDRCSEGSLLLLIVTYFPYVFLWRPASLGPNVHEAVLRQFRDVALFCAFAGIAQFFAQFFIHAPWLFDFTPSIPSILQVQGRWNTVIPVGSHYKSNGFFFREPSGFSFIMGLALVLEWSSPWRRLWRVTCFGLALLLTYSGSGILTVIIGMLFPLGPKTLLRVLGLAAAGLLILWLLGDALNLSFTVNRVQEFGSERSSAYDRFIAPARLILETYDTDSWTVWLGHGPGSITRTVMGYDFHDPTWAKLIFEYGVPELVAFFTLFWAVLRSPQVPIRLRAILFISWSLLGGHLLAPEPNVLTPALAGWFPAASARGGNPSRRRARPSLPRRL